MVSITQHKPLLYALLGVAFVVFFASVEKTVFFVSLLTCCVFLKYLSASEFSPDLNELLQLVPFPNLQFRKGSRKCAARHSRRADGFLLPDIVQTMLFDMLGAFAVEHICRRIFVS